MTYAPPDHVSDLQVCAALLADNAADAMRGDWDALCWIASSRCDLVCEALGRDAASDRTHVVRRWIVRPSEAEITAAVDHALWYASLYRQLGSVRKVAEAVAEAPSRVYRALRDAGIEIAPWGSREGRKAA